MNQIENFLTVIKINLFGGVTSFTQNDLILILILIIFIILIFNFFSKRKLKKKIESIPGLELNNKIFSDIKKINNYLNELLIHKKDTERNFKSIFKAFSNVEIIKSKKYNPYADMGVGGNQSFSVAFVNNLGNGVIMTSLYSRERTRVLLKEIKNFQSEQELTKEEMEVLEKVKNNI